MSNGEKQLIHVLLIIIALASLILVVRIKFTPQYDPEIYKRVYSEYENIIEVSQETETNEESNVNTTDENHTNDNDNDTFDADNININDEYLKIAPTKLAGSQMHEVGNYCIAGHNYDNNPVLTRIQMEELKLH